MDTTLAGVLDALDSRVEAMMAACTRCGKCVEACPMPPLAGIDRANPGEVMGGVIEGLRTGSGPRASRRWSEVCSGSGECIEACDEGVNPRFLLAMLRRKQAKAADLGSRRAAGKAQFQKMSRGVRVLSRLQLPPALLERLSPSSHPDRDEPPELIFYTGCNLLKTPHIGLLCLDVLDRLEVRYEVHGGPSSCCGILQMRGGDDENALRQGSRTLQRFAASQAPEVLSWCPTCQLQFSETTLPVQINQPTPAFDLTMFPVYLARRIEELRPFLTRPVNKRVALHEHPGTAGVVEAVHTLLEAIPGLEVVDLNMPKLGYSINALAAVPNAQKGLLAKELSKAETAGVDMLVSVYHTEHREFAAHASRLPFEVGSYMELIGASMGISREDVFKRLHAMRDVDAILADSAATLQANAVDPEEAREVVAQMLGDHILELDRQEQQRYLR